MIEGLRSELLRISGVRSLRGRRDGNAGRMARTITERRTINLQSGRKLSRSLDGRVLHKVSGDVRRASQRLRVAAVQPGRATVRKLRDEIP